MNAEREPLPTHIRDTPALPPTYDAALRTGLTHAGLALRPEAREAIDAHLRLLLAWTEAINLTAIRDPETAATAHVLDSLSAIGLLRDRGIERFLDLGSGGGLPGIPLAAALPAAEAMLVEPIGKKARFLATAIAASGLDATVRVAATRAETLAGDPRHRGRWPAVTSRAVGRAAELVELAFPLLAPGGMLIAWKRGDLEDERRSAATAVQALGGGHLEILDVRLPGLVGHRLMVATRTGAVPAAYPRDPGARKRHPW